MEKLNKLAAVKWLMRLETQLRRER